MNEKSKPDFVRDAKDDDGVVVGPGGTKYDAEHAQEEELADCRWLENLSHDPYYRGVQDQVCLPLELFNAVMLSE